ncbi:MAG: MBL fold metallo-hydrolase, partial [Candidatus Harrisonbacteria bacterium]|nr:MBL fold metallo-hydrolase [Candidatus Harrisonbacteria bacterium]
MRMTFYGGVKVVTGANYLVESGDTRILIDCGMHQGSNFCEKHNFEPFPYEPKSIHAVFVTHAHIDHIGRLPKLHRDGFRGAVYSTPPTRDFSELMLIDSEHIIIEDAKKFKKEPIYNIQSVNDIMSVWEGIPYHTTVRVGPFTVTLYNAGHILGSSLILVEAEGKKVLFSGDLGNSPAPIIGNAESLSDADAVVVESTYGNRIHEPSNTRKEALEDVIEDTVKNSGVLMIPAFAMERTQELLFEINNLAEQGRIPRVPIFIDSPLAIKLTAVYKKYEMYFDEAARAMIGRGDAIFNFPGLHTTLTTEESKTINEIAPPKVIIAGSGMSNGGRILHHEARYLPDPNSTIIFVGYQSVGTLGRMILDGAKEVKIFGEKVPVRCRVQAIPAYSAHADQPQLLAWLAPLRASAKIVFVVQGEGEASKALAQKIKDELALSAVVPEERKSYDIL